MNTAESVTAEFRCELPPTPYPGLRPFEAREWPVFFGREIMADEVITRIVKDNLLVVHGDSGCGKSSLIYAGVLPHLEQEAARTGVHWRTCASVPGDHPLDNLAAALAGLDGGKPDPEPLVTMRRILNFGGDGATALVEQLGVTPSNRVCILVDQFEELFAHAKQHGSHEASLLIELLIGIQRQATSGLSAVLTMRSEFLGACVKFPGFAEAVNTAQYLLPRMNHGDLMRAICEPATLFNGEIERQLAENLIADVGGAQDQLPLIQHGLMMLYRDHVVRAGVKPGERWQLTAKTCKQDGRRLSSMLSDHASEVADSVGEERVVEDLFRALTDMNSDGYAVRRPRMFAQLVAVTGGDEPQLRGIIDAFRADGVSFLRPYGTRRLEAGDRIDISHEALIRCWRRIADPEDGWLVREFKNGLVWHSLLVQADSFERNPSNVLSPATTDERTAWLKRRNPGWAERYGGGWDRVSTLIDASVTERNRQLLEQEEDRKREEESRIQKMQLEAKARTVRIFRAGIVVTLVLATIGIALAIYAFQERDRANAERQTAEFESQRNLQARVRAEERSRELEQVSSNLKTDVEKLQATTQQKLTETQLRAQLEKTQGNIAQQVDWLASVANPPRIYVHISDESQREATRQLVLRLEKTRIGKDLIVIPGIEVKPWKGNELRCFVAVECKEAAQLTEILNKLLIYPQIKVVETLKRGATAKLRARHYELWLSPGNIEIEGSVRSYAPVQQNAVADR